MDYKEKYEQSLERARNIRFGNPQSATANTVCEEIFPELKESEDERIRKDIIKVFTGEIGFTTKEEAEKYIAWLKKQGEQKPTDKVGPKLAWSEEDEIVLDNLIYALGNDRIGNYRYEYVDWLKSLKERMKNSEACITHDYKIGE